MMHEQKIGPCACSALAPDLSTRNHRRLKTRRKWGHLSRWQDYLKGGRLSPSTSSASGTMLPCCLCIREPSRGGSTIAPRSDTHAIPSHCRIRLSSVLRLLPLSVPELPFFSVVRGLTKLSAQVFVGQMAGMHVPSAQVSPLLEAEQAHAELLIRTGDPVHAIALLRRLKV